MRDDQPIRFSTSFALPIMVLVATMLAALVLVAWQLAGRLDQQALEREVSQVEAAFAGEAEENRVGTQNQVIWTEAVDRISIAHDKQWATSNLGPALNKYLGFEAHLVVDGQGKTIYGAWRHEVVSLPGTALFGPGFVPFFERLRTIPEKGAQGMVEFQTLNGRVFMLSGGRIVPEDEDPRSNAPPAWFLVAEEITPKLMTKISRDFRVDGIRVLPGPPPRGVTAIGLKDIGNRDVAHVVWNVSTPGTDLLRRYAPWLLLLVASALVISVGVLLHARNATRRLDQNRREAIDRALRDELTGLGNRRALFAAHEARSCSALLLIDFDGFKQANDRFGHAAGDEVLREAARRMQAQVAGQHDAFRLGGDEFAVLVHGERDVAESLANGLVRALAEPIEWRGSVVDGVTASVGVAIAGAQEALEPLLRRADVAMYLAKHAGKNQLAIAAEEDVEELSGQTLRKRA